MWFFFVSVAAHFSSVAHLRMHFAMNWYSFVFPNTALTTATFAIATALDGNRAFNIVGCILTVALILTWIFVFSNMVRAVYLKHILWPQMQEDRDEGGWGKDGKKRKQEQAILSPSMTRHASFLHGFTSATGIPLHSSNVFNPLTADFDKPDTMDEDIAKEVNDEEKGQAGWMPWKKMEKEMPKKTDPDCSDSNGTELELQMTRIEKLEARLNPT
jgi:hypothetical protein